MGFSGGGGGGGGITGYEVTVAHFTSGSSISSNATVAADYGNGTHIDVNSTSNSISYFFEADLVQTAAPNTAYCGVWDVTTGALVPNSTISTTSVNHVAVRSSAFTLIAGHTYSIALWVSGGSVYVINARILGVI